MYFSWVMSFHGPEGQKRKKPHVWFTGKKSVLRTSGIALSDVRPALVSGIGRTTLSLGIKGGS
jgi:hypothetical protein